jgi:hypothetical protein
MFVLRAGGTHTGAIVRGRLQLGGSRVEVQLGAPWFRSDAIAKTRDAQDGTRKARAPGAGERENLNAGQMNAGVVGG